MPPRMYRTLSYEFTPPVVVIRLRRPRASNRVNLALASELRQACQQLAEEGCGPRRRHHRRREGFFLWSGAPLPQPQGGSVHPLPVAGASPGSVLAGGSGDTHHRRHKRRRHGPGPGAGPGLRPAGGGPGRPAGVQPTIRRNRALGWWHPAASAAGGAGPGPGDAIDGSADGCRGSPQRGTGEHGCRT